MVTPQPVPVVSAADVHRVVNRDFPVERRDEVHQCLAEYVSTSGSAARVHLAVLKLSAGDLASLRSWLQVARVDFRDVLAPAEYPEYFRRLRGDNSMSLSGLEEVVASDWRQYCSWLER